MTIPLRSLCAFCLCVFISSPLLAQDDDGAPAGGNVYKQVDPEGNVTYTDKPPSADAKAMKVPKGTEYSPPPVPTFTPATPTPKTTRFGYDSFTIVAPKQDESIWDNTGNLTVSVAHEPFLQPGHSIEFLLDGQPVSRGTATSYQFTNMDRGTHQLTARIVDGKDNEIESASVTFHMKRHSIGVGN